MKWWGWMLWSSFFECRVLSQLFRSPLSPSSKDSLVSLCFLPLRVVSSAYLWLLIFLLAILIPSCASSSLAFCMIYSAYKLNNRGDNIQPWRTPFPIWNQSIVPCPVLTVASWPAYRFLRREVNFPKYRVGRGSRIYQKRARGLTYGSWGKNPGTLS